uniref:Uncharacterized protein n=1 Tax=Syphacia muris TaxID=451379 RepID=A0A158R585_9BILA
MGHLSQGIDTGKLTLCNCPRTVGPFHDPRTNYTMAGSVVGTEWGLHLSTYKSCPLFREGLPLETWKPAALVGDISFSRFGDGPLARTVKCTISSLGSVVRPHGPGTLLLLTRKPTA